MEGTNERTSLTSNTDGRRTEQQTKMAGRTSLASAFWCPLVFVLCAAAVLGLRMFMQHRGQYSPPQLSWDEEVNIAFVGNSMFYFNDFPRFFQIFSAGRKKISQNSCLHGGGSIPSLLLEGNSMFPQFKTPAAELNTVDSKGHTLYDYGACTVEQLLTGTDDRLDDPGYAVPEDESSINWNPCREDSAYLDYAKHFFQTEQPGPTRQYWDYVLVNDNTRNPARAETRARSLQFLEQFYVPWLLQTGATPVFLWTQAYSIESTPTRDMTGLTDVANFTSLTGVGYREYVELLKLYLPEATQSPRIAPVGLAFLLVYEERPDIWATLFHSDHLHASPSGTFLQGCIVYHTLFGEMPPKDWVIRHMTSLWKTARMMQHAWEPANPMVDVPTAEYLYRVAERIMMEGEIPSTYIDYQNGEVADLGSEI